MMNVFLAVCAAGAAVSFSAAAQTPLETWAKIYEVFSHPRCANCHVPADGRPRWSGPSYGEARFHGMFVHGGETRIGADAGLLCSACHGPTNAPIPHGPPGAEVWLLAPVEMVWWDRSSLEICEQIKDPARNGGKDLEAVAQHIEKDELVHWGWEPGPGREPAPYSVEELAGFIRAWADGGAPCPTEQSGASP